MNYIKIKIINHPNFIKLLFPHEVIVSSFNLIYNKYHYHLNFFLNNFFKSYFSFLYFHKKIISFFIKIEHIKIIHLNI